MGSGPPELFGYGIAGRGFRLTSNEKFSNISWILRLSQGDKCFGDKMKAVILAGGLGTRLKPFTEVIPKPLLPIGAKSVLEIQVGRLKKFGFTDIFLATNYKADFIKAFLGDGSRYGVNIFVSEEKKTFRHSWPTHTTEKIFKRTIRCNEW